MAAMATPATTPTKEQQLENARQVARQVLAAAENIVEDCPVSWLHGTIPATPPSPRCQYFDAQGFWHQPGFVDATMCARMKQSMEKLVERWDPSETDSFGTDDQSNVIRGDYFLESAMRTHHFCEPHALQPDTTNILKPEYQHENKLQALNKSGHGLHLDATLPTGPQGALEPNPFYEYCHSPQLAELVTDFGWRDPVVPQSMYIYKQKILGGAVHAHQDSTFLWTEPRQTCLGLWLALDDATLENGCLWVRPQSHREPIRRQYCRNEAHFGAASIAERSNQVRGDPQQPTFAMKKQLLSNTPPEAVPWEGSIPGDGSIPSVLEAGFCPVECRAGDLLIFNGALDHLSLANASNQARHTFQLHLVEGPAAGIVWSKSNWLQYPQGQPFVRLGGADKKTSVE